MRNLTKIFFIGKEGRIFALGTIMKYVGAFLIVIWLENSTDTLQRASRNAKHPAMHRIMGNFSSWVPTVASIEKHRVRLSSNHLKQKYYLKYVIKILENIIPKHVFSWYTVAFSPHCIYVCKLNELEHINSLL